MACDHAEGRLGSYFLAASSQRVQNRLADLSKTVPCRVKFTRQQHLLPAQPHAPLQVACVYLYQISLDILAVCVLWHKFRYGEDEVDVDEEQGLLKKEVTTTRSPVEEEPPEDEDEPPLEGDPESLDTKGAKQKKKKKKPKHKAGEGKTGAYGGSAAWGQGGSRPEATGCQTSAPLNVLCALSPFTTPLTTLTTPLLSQLLLLFPPKYLPQTHITCFCARCSQDCGLHCGRSHRGSQG